MRHVDLCSGIGGFALGFEWAKLSKPALFCDIEPWSRKILAKHWPDVPIAEDVKELASDPGRLVPDHDIITAGYPCQPFSMAGQRRGEEDDRHIWPEIFAIVQAKGPYWCVFENVYGHVSMGLDEVLSDLESENYTCQAFIVPACAVDAPHRRDRVWIVANSGGLRCNAGWSQQSLQGSGASSKTWQIASHSDSNSQSDGTIHEQRMEQTARDDTDTDSTGLQGQRQKSIRIGQKQHHIGNTCGWLPEPPVGRVANGIPGRVDRLRGLGNAIVPQVAMQIGLTIKDCENGTKN